MSELPPTAVNIDEYLGLNKYEVDEGHPHIEPMHPAPAAEFAKLVRVCPAGLYKLGPDGGQLFDYAGCLECGTCRVIGLGTALTSWEYPQPTMGVEYRYG